MYIFIFIMSFVRSRTIEVRSKRKKAQLNRIQAAAREAAKAAAKEEGAAVKKRMDTHKMAEANKAFSHFRF